MPKLLDDAVDDSTERLRLPNIDPLTGGIRCTAAERVFLGLGAKGYRDEDVENDSVGALFACCAGALPVAECAVVCEKDFSLGWNSIFNILLVLLVLPLNCLVELNITADMNLLLVIAVNTISDMM